jgi:hypothetical protein
MVELRTMHVILNSGLLKLGVEYADVICHGSSCVPEIALGRG